VGTLGRDSLSLAKSIFEYFDWRNFRKVFMALTFWAKDEASRSAAHDCRWELSFSRVNILENVDSLICVSSDKSSSKLRT